MVEMSVLEAVKEFDEFAQFLCTDAKMMKDVLTDDNYRVRVDYHDKVMRFEIGFSSDEWHIK